MMCPLCGSDSKVLNSRPLHGNVWRRRECVKCLHRWNTYEVTELAFRHVERVQAIVAEIIQEERTHNG
jgi:transcriptional regulator NrdR family protein